MHRIGFLKRTAQTLMALGLLSACVTAPPEPAPISPVARPPIAVEPAVLTSPPSANSTALSVYYQRLQNDLLAQDLLRRDGGGFDTPFNARQLSETFIRIALFDEFTSQGGRLVAQATESKLRRWNRPIRMSVEFGASVPLDQRSADRAFVANYSSRLARLTGLSISQSQQAPNFYVLVLGEDDRRGFETRLRQIAPGLSETSIQSFLAMPRETLCYLFATTENDASPHYLTAVAVVRAEHPDLMRQGCFHEEIAQGLGLANDSPNARPSIFNDDEEFGLLTTHDEMLLKMLYDPRMRTGMTAQEAAPIATTIATELLGGPV